MLDLLVRGITNVVVNEIMDRCDYEDLQFADDAIESFKLVAKEIDSMFED